MKNKKIILFGTKIYAEYVYDYFTMDSDFEVIAFTVDREYITEKSFQEKPVIAFEDLEKHFNMEEVYLHIAIGYSDLNEIRARKFYEVSKKGYKIASYISSKANIFNKKIGKNCLIFEGVSVEPRADIGDNVIIASNSVIAHHVLIGNHVFISSGVLINGKVKVGDKCFIGAGAKIMENIVVGEKCFLGMNTYVTRNMADETVVIAPKSQIIDMKSSQFVKKIANRGF